MKLTGKMVLPIEFNRKDREGGLEFFVADRMVH
jgi:hypothetical protein